MRLSVLTPSYNYDRYLRDCLSSVAGQGNDVEHVVVDDESTDGSWDTLGAWSGRLVLSQHANRGLAATLNEALDRATGEWIGWLNADDFYLPWTRECLETVAARNPDAALIFGDSVFVDEHSRFTRLAPEHSHSDAILRQYGPYIAPPAMFVRRSVLEGFRFDTETIKLMDWDLYLAVRGRGGRFCYIPRTLGAFRRHSEQQSNRITPRAETERIRRRYDLPLGERQERWALRQGKVRHAFGKLTQGSYWRQRRASEWLGEDLRWWQDKETRIRVEEFGRVIG